jgi:hypothetical protein
MEFGPRQSALAGARRPHFPEVFSCARIGSFTGPFLFLLNAKPMIPTTTKAAPAIISQCGYCIAERSLFPPSDNLDALFKCRLEEVFNSGSATAHRPR